jgi:lipopolysaccharide transport system permease protein
MTLSVAGSGDETFARPPQIRNEDARVLEETVISPGRMGRRYVRDLWKYRELFVFLAWRDLLVRYKQTAIGVAWSLIRPLVTMVVLSVVFGRIGNMPSGGVPYPLLVFCGVLPWQFFATALADSGGSLVANSGLISKVYFPRLIIPAGTVVTGLVDFLISFVLLVALMVWYRWVPPVNIVWLPVFLVLTTLVSFGAGVWVAALTVEYRDFRFIVPFVVQFGLYISPVGFLSSTVPAKYRALYAMNPMVGAIDGFRWAVLGGSHTLSGSAIAWSAGCAALLLVTGISHFRRTERTFADVI